MSKNLHVVTTTVSADALVPEHNGAAWAGSFWDGAPFGNDLSPDADGEFNPGSRPVFIVDLSHMLSRVLGKQMPMTATYRVVGIRIGLVNVDAGVDDNDRGAFFGGYIYTHGAQKHKIDALQAGRAVERASEGAEMDSDSVLFSPVLTYTGFRFNWSGDDQVKSPTDAGLVGDWVSVTGNVQWNLAQLLNLYSQGLSCHSDQYMRALWTDRTGGANIMRWSCALNNAMHKDGVFAGVELIENPDIQDYVWEAGAGRHLDVVGGLMAVEVRHSNTIPNGDASPDDYKFQVEVMVEGWSDW